MEARADLHFRSPTCVYPSKNRWNFWIETIRRPFGVWRWSPSPHAVLAADALIGHLRVYSQGQNCLPCHLLCLTFKMMKHGESDPWQDLFKEQPRGNGRGVQSLAACWGIDQPLTQRPNTESLARGEGHAGRGAILRFEALSNTSAVSPHE